MYGKNMVLNSGDVYVIAEIGGNHEGNLDYAFKLTDLAIESGADAIKYQIYSPDGLVNKNLDKRRYEHFKKFTLSFSDFEKLANRCSNAGVEFMSSIWQDDAIEYFDRYINVHKVGSGDLTNHILLNKLVHTEKPIILSTAMSSLEEIHSTVNFITSCNPLYRTTGMLAILQCVAMYGEPRDQYANLNVVDTLRKEFPNKLIGYSDHTVGTLACEVAVSKGARVLEVHFTDDKTRDFRDHHISMDQQDLRDLIHRISSILELSGNSRKVPVAQIETEDRIKEFRRGVYLNQNYSAGTVIKQSMLTCLRPFDGIAANDAFKLVGRQLNRNIEALQPLSFEYFE